MVPALGASRPTARWRSVVLPAPLGPTRPTTWPEGAAAGTAAGQSLVLELAIGLQDGVGVDGQLPHDLLDRRQLVALPQHSDTQGLADLLDDLEIGGDAGAAVQRDLD